MSWRYWSVSSGNWTSKVRVFPSEFPWTRVLNGGAGDTAKFNLGSKRVAETATKANMAPWSRLLVNEFQGQIIYAGFITGSRYEKRTKTYTVTHEDLWAVFARRIAVSILDVGVEATQLKYVGRSLANIINELMYEGQNDAARFNLPIVLPTADEPGPHQRTYKGYELATVADLIQDILDDDNGPDLDLYPRWLGDKVEWYARIGNLRDGRWSWDVDAPKSRVSNLVETIDGKDMANRVVAVGTGSEKKMKLAISDGSAASPFLPLDAVTSYKNEVSRTRLASRARADRRARDRPTEQIGMDVGMDADFAVHQLRLGGTVRWHTQGDPYFPDGWKDSRLIRYSGDMTNTIHLEFQTEEA